MISAQVVSRIPGKETDHSRGHWPSEAFVHLVIGARMLEEYGYSHTVYVDATVYDAVSADQSTTFLNFNNCTNQHQEQQHHQQRQQQYQQKHLQLNQHQ